MNGRDTHTLMRPRSAHALIFPLYLLGLLQFPPSPQAPRYFVEIPGFFLFSAGTLFTGDLTGVEDAMLIQLDHWVTNAGRRALMVTSENDKACTGWARIPSGAKTCAFWVIRHFVDTVRVKGQFTEGHLNGHGWLTCGTEFPSDWTQEQVFEKLIMAVQTLRLDNLSPGINVFKNGNTEFSLFLSLSKNNVLTIRTFHVLSTK